MARTPTHVPFVTSAILSLAALLCAAAPPAAAQRPAPRTAAQPAAGQPVRFALSGGLAVPTGDLGDATNLGFGVTGSADFRPTGFPVGLRADASFTRLGMDKSAYGNVRSGAASVVGGQLNALVRFGGAGTRNAAATTYRPYVLGGLGLYRAGYAARLTGGGKADESETVLGFGFGGGMEFRTGGYETFVEARYQNIRTEKVSFTGDASSFVPIVFGVRF